MALRTASAPKASGPRLQGLLDAFPAEACVIDEYARIVRVNQPWREFAESGGLQMPDHGVGGDYLGFLDPSAPDEVLEACQGIMQVLVGECPLYTSEYFCPGPAGPAWFRMIVTPIKASRPHALLVHENVTARHDAEVESTMAKRALETANEELQAFNYSVSHDLKAPLRAIVMFCTALGEAIHENDLAEADRLVERIRGEGIRSSQLVADLLTLSGSTRSDIRMTDIDVSALAATVADEFRASSPTRDHPEIVIQSGLHARADPGLTRVLLENLIGNAWKYTRDNPHPRIEIGAQQGEFFVRDNGIGFDPAGADIIFHPFQRLHPQHRFEGSGVGLATVKRIVERHGGHVWAESTPDVGSTFHFEFPMHTAADPT